MEQLLVLWHHIDGQASEMVGVFTEDNSGDIIYDYIVGQGEEYPVTAYFNLMTGSYCALSSGDYLTLDTIQLNQILSYAV